MTVEEGIRLRPSLKEGGHAAYEAFVYDPRERRKIRRTFTDLTAARKWRKDMAAKLRVAPEQVPAHDTRTLEKAMGEWLEKCRRGAVKSRRGLNYGAQTLAGYERNLRNYVFPDIGRRKFAQLTRRDLQAFVERLNESGLHGRTVRNVVVPLSAFYGYERDTVPQDPTVGLRLPDATARRRSVVTPGQAFALLDAIPDEETRSFYALAFFAGLRRGEIRAFDEGNLRADRIVLTHSYDETAKTRVPLKWRKDGDERTIPRTKALGRYLGALPGASISNNTIRRRAETAWGIAAVGAFLTSTKTELRDEPLELHECRHSFAVWLDAAGVSNSRANRYTGHSDNSMGEHYRAHDLTPMQLAADAEALDAYLDAFTTPVANVVSLEAVKQKEKELSRARS